MRATLRGLTFVLSTPRGPDSRVLGHGQMWEHTVRTGFTGFRSWANAGTRHEDRIPGFHVMELKKELAYKKRVAQSKGHSLNIQLQILVQGAGFTKGAGFTEGTGFSYGTYCVLNLLCDFLCNFVCRFFNFL